MDKVSNGELVPMTQADSAALQAFRAVVPIADPIASFIPVAMLRQRIEKLGMWDGFSAYLVLNPTEMLKVLTVDRGLVDPAYPALQVAFDSMDVPAEARAYILAPPSAGVPDV